MTPSAGVRIGADQEFQCFADSILGADGPAGSTHRQRAVGQRPVPSASEGLVDGSAGAGCAGRVTWRTPLVGGGGDRGTEQSVG